MLSADYTNGRIRVNEATAIEAMAAFKAHVNYLLDVRDEVVGYPDARKDVNARIKAIRRGMKELQRTADEHGWALDQTDELLRQDQA